MKFGDMVKRFRMEQGLTAKAFCKSAKVDYRKWERMEKGMNKPTKDQFEVACAYFNIPPTDYPAFSDAFFIARKQIPSYLNGEDISDMLPLVFCLARGEKPSKQEIVKFVKLILENI